MKFAQSENAVQAKEMITGLQSYFAEHLSKVHKKAIELSPLMVSENTQGFERVQWERNQGENGGGFRLQAKGLTKTHIDEGVRCLPLLNRGSINFSQVHYENTEKRLNSATAISTIIHPHLARLPSVHMHTSFTELKNGSIGFRIMADINPSYLDSTSKEKFTEQLKLSAQEFAEKGLKQGDAYFNIPFLHLHRGVSHFYLEDFLVDNSFDKTLEFAEKFTKNMMDTYCSILVDSLEQENELSPRVASKGSLEGPFDLQQIAYHSAYFAQVLLLDRGTTSGLLAHDQNDVGTMGSIPAILDVSLLKMWMNEKFAENPLQRDLLSKLVAICELDSYKVNTLSSDDEIHLCFVCESMKDQLAKAARKFYTENPEALKLQAKGFSLPKAYSNHKD